MLHPQRGRCDSVSSCRFRSSERDPEHDVHADIVKSCVHSVANGLFRLLRGVETSEVVKEFLFEALAAQGETVDPGFSEFFQILLCHGSRIAFHGDLSVTGDPVMLMQEIEDIGHLRGFQEGRSPSSEVDRVRFDRLKGPDLVFQRLKKARPQVVLYRDRIEVAVGTFPDTERYVDIDPVHRLSFLSDAQRFQVLFLFIRDAVAFHRFLYGLVVDPFRQAALLKVG